MGLMSLMSRGEARIFCGNVSSLGAVGVGVGVGSALGVDSGVGVGMGSASTIGACAVERVERKIQPLALRMRKRMATVFQKESVGFMAESAARRCKNRWG